MATNYLSLESLILDDHDPAGCAVTAFHFQWQAGEAHPGLGKPRQVAQVFNDRDFAAQQDLVRRVP